MNRKLAVARRLSYAELQLFLQAWVLLLLVDWGLRTLPFQTVQQILRVRYTPRPLTGDSAWRSIVLRRKAVWRAARHHLYPMTCLRRSLVLQRLLAGCAIETDLRFGVRKINGQLEAHAWLEYHGEPLDEPGIFPDPFVPLSSKNL